VPKARDAGGGGVGPGPLVPQPRAGDRPSQYTNEATDSGVQRAMGT